MMVNQITCTPRAERHIQRSGFVYLDLIKYFLLLLQKALSNQWSNYLISILFYDEYISNI